MRGLSRLKLAVLLGLVVLLGGCSDRPLDFYLFGAAQSCFPNKDSATCDKLKVYDKVTLKVLVEAQEVTYVQAGLGLDESNTVFHRLQDCKVIDRDNFACDGIVRTDGHISKTAIFGGRVASESYWPYAYSHYLSQPIGRRALGFWAKYGAWIVGVLVVIGSFGLMSSK